MLCIMFILYKALLKVMNLKSELNQKNHPLSPAKIILFTVISISVFVTVAIIYDQATSWITLSPVKVVVREIFLRLPLTLISLHLFAKKVIKSYDPNTIYRKVSLFNLFQWQTVGFILPLLAWRAPYSVRRILIFVKTPQ